MAIRPPEDGVVTGLLGQLLAPAPAAAYGNADDFWYQPVNSMSNAGQAVTTETALQVDAFFACLRVITETMGYVPWFVYRRLSNGGRERAPEHPLYAKLHDQPNKWQTAFEWKEMISGHIILRGHAYNRIVPGASGPFDQLVPLHPDRVKEEKLPSGVIRYKVMNERGLVETLDYNEVFHIPGLWGGQSILGAARENLGEALAAQNYSSRSFQNRITPPGAIKFPGSFKDTDAAERLRKQWQDTYSGSSNAGKPLILENGMEWQQLGMTNEDAQFLQTRQHSIPAIARRFRIPLTMIGYESNTSNFGTGVEQYQISFVVFSMLAWFGRFESRGNVDLMVDPTNYYTEFLAEALLRGDSKTQAEALQIERANGVINGDEWRLLKNRLPAEDGSGRDFWRPANMVPANTPVGTIGRAPGGAAADPRAATFARVLAGQIVRKETERIKALAKRHSDDGMGWESDVRAFYAALAPEISDRCHIEPGLAGNYAEGWSAEVISRGVGVADGWEDNKVLELQTLMLAE